MVGVGGIPGGRRGVLRLLAGLAAAGVLVLWTGTASNPPVAPTALVEAPSGETTGAPWVVVPNANGVQTATSPAVSSEAGVATPAAAGREDIFDGEIPDRTRPTAGRPPGLPTAPPPVPLAVTTSGCAMLERVDMRGGDARHIPSLAGATADACCTACQQAADCVGFVWSRGRCYFKEAIVVGTPVESREAASSCTTANCTPVRDSPASVSCKINVVAPRAAR